MRDMLLIRPRPVGQAGAGNHADMLCAGPPAVTGDRPERNPSRATPHSLERGGAGRWNPGCQEVRPSFDSLW